MSRVLYRTVGGGRPAATRSPLPVRGFYFTSYSNNDLAHATNGAQLDAFRSEIPTASHAVACVQVVSGGVTANTVSRTIISENPGNLVPWFNLAKGKGLKVALIIILFTDNNFSWGGNWQPTNPTTALANYYTTVKPYLQAAQTAGCEFVILVDEWSTLFYSYQDNQVVPPFTTLFNSARNDFTGPLSLNVNRLEETSIKLGIVALTDFVGITAYVPLTNSNTPTYDEMKANLLGNSSVTAVAAQVNEYKAIWGDASVHGYMSYVRHIAESDWHKPVLLTTGYKSTAGGAVDPGGDIPETTIDTVTQSRAWNAFIDAAKDGIDGIGNSLYGFLGWQQFAVATSAPMGYPVLGKVAASTINGAW